MPLVLGGSAVVTPAYSITNSCRFNLADSAYMTKTLGTPSSQKQFTFSCWFKRGLLGAHMTLMSAGNTSDAIYTSYRYENNGVMRANVDSANSDTLQTDQMFKDVSAWYHIVVTVDTPNAVEAERIRFYINGTRLTGPWGQEGYPTQDADIGSFASGEGLQIGRRIRAEDQYLDGYMAEALFCDGQAYDASDFGEFDSASPTIWKPTDPSELTFGNNGFWLDFKDSANLGNDANGGTDLTETNLAANDQATDTPTNNFAVMNPVDNYFASGTFTQGNCNIVHPSSSNNAFCTSTIWLSSGKWYAEAKVVTTATGDGQLIGMSSVVSPAASNAGSLGETTANYGYYGNDGGYRHNASTISYGSAYGVNAIIGIYLDLDNNKLYFGEDGTIQNSGTGITIIAASLQPSGLYTMGGGDWTSSTGVQWAWNFGGCSAFDVTSAQQDVNGYGNFEYSPNDGGSASFDSSAKDFLAICTKNLGSDGG